MCYHYLPLYTFYRLDYIHLFYQAIGSQDGTISCHNLVLSTVHGLYRDRYAYRENLTNVTVQLLSSVETDDPSGASKISLKCHELIKKISIYKDKLAVS